MTAAALRSPVSTLTGGGIDCLVSYRANVPRDRMGNHLSESGRWLILEAVSALYGFAGGGLARDGHRRWGLPEHGLRASVAHCGPLSAVVVSAGAWVGVDVQDERDRPGAMAWLGALLGRPEGEPASIRDFAECEALIKASHLTKESFAGVRLPPWRSAWRPTEPPYHVLSTRLDPGIHLALVADAPVEVRWWWQRRPGGGPRRLSDPREASATEVRQ